MPTSWRQFLAMAIVLALAVAGLAYRWQPPTNPSATTPLTPESASNPDLVLQQPLLETFDNSGVRSRLVRGQDFQYFNRLDQSLISLPTLDFQPAGKNTKDTPWHLRADTAIITPAKNDVSLQGNVLLWNDNLKNGHTEIRSESMNVDTQRQFARTDKAVTIRGRRSEVRSTGLQADLTSEHLLLTSHVKEIHEVAKRP